MFHFSCNLHIFRLKQQDGSSKVDVCYWLFGLWSLLIFNLKGQVTQLSLNIWFVFLSSSDFKYKKYFKFFTRMCTTCNRELCLQGRRGCQRNRKCNKYWKFSIYLHRMDLGKEQTWKIKIKIKCLIMRWIDNLLCYHYIFLSTSCFSAYFLMP